MVDLELGRWWHSARGKLIFHSPVYGWGDGATAWRPGGADRRGPRCKVCVLKVQNLCFKGAKYGRFVLEYLAESRM